MVGLLVIVTGILQIGGLLPTPNKTSANPIPPGVSLVSVSFMKDQWNPRMIDLRTAASEGIHAEPGISLELFDVEVSVPDNMPADYQAQVEVYANDDEFIGKTGIVPLEAGKVARLGTVFPTNYKHDTVDNNWRVQDDWGELAILVNVYKKGDEKVAQSTKTHVKFTTPSSKSWLISPPYASFVSIVYQVNDGERTVLDFRAATTYGLDIQAGDRFRIWEIWYHT